MSRTVNGEWLLKTVEKERLRREIWRVAEYCGVEVITYAVMSNHFHLVVRIPRKCAINDGQLLERWSALHGGCTARARVRLEAIEAMLASGGEAAALWRSAQIAMMGDLSRYLQLLKQRFSVWYNRTHNRFGPLWADRFKSVLLESGRAVQAVAAYVDLNPVRAGIVDDPGRYRYCGYAEAIAGNRVARRGIASLYEGLDWNEAAKAYLAYLGSRASIRSGTQTRRDCEAVGAGLGEGAFDLACMLGRRCRYLTSGMILGGRAFVMEQWAAHRHRIGRPSSAEPRAFPGGGAELAIMSRLPGTA